MEMLRNYLGKQEIAILENLQKSNATTDQELVKVGLTPTDLVKEYGLNKNQMLKHLPTLKQKGLIIGKQIQKKGRPGNYYAITPIGFFLITKNKLANEGDEKQFSEVEQIKNQIPLIAKHWDNELVELNDYRHQSLFNAVDFLDFKFRKKHYLSLSMTLPETYGKKFISFEKIYFSSITSNNEPNNQTDLNKEQDQAIQNLLAIEPVNEILINELTNDIVKFLTFQFYYCLDIIPKNTLRMINHLTKHNKPKKEIFKKLLERARQYQSLLGYDYNLTNPKKLEAQLVQRSKEFSKIVKSVIEKDQELKDLINKQSLIIRSTSNSILDSFQSG